MDYGDCVANNRRALCFQPKLSISKFNGRWVYETTNHIQSSGLIKSSFDTWLLGWHVCRLFQQMLLVKWKRKTWSREGESSEWRQMSSSWQRQTGLMPKCGLYLGKYEQWEYHRQQIILSMLWFLHRKENTGSRFGDDALTFKYATCRCIQEVCSRTRKMFLMLLLAQVCPGWAESPGHSTSLAHCRMHFADALGNLKGFVKVAHWWIAGTRRKRWHYHWCARSETITTRQSFICSSCSLLYANVFLAFVLILKDQFCSVCPESASSAS